MRAKTAEEEIERWKSRSIRLRRALLDISGGCEDPAKRAADAIDYEAELLSRECKESK